MSSQNKKKKGKNSYTYGDHAMKEVTPFKGVNFYNSSMRKRLKKLLRKDIENE